VSLSGPTARNSNPKLEFYQVPSNGNVEGSNRLGALPPSRPTSRKQGSRSNAERFCNVPDRNDGGVSLSGLEAAHVPLRDADARGQSFLGHACGGPFAPYVFAHDPPNIHRGMAGEPELSCHVL